MKHFDIAVIGTGPAGQKGAIQAAKLGKRVVIVERNNVLGGAQINTGTIPSKALREAVLHLTGHSKRGLFGDAYRVKKNITIADLVAVSHQVIRREWEVIRDQFDRNNIELLWGAAHFEGPNLLQITRDDEAEMITADKFLVACGTKPAKPRNVPFNGRTVFSSDDILHLDHLPKSMIVVGGGVIGTEYACIMATLGVRVTLIEGRHEVLGFLDTEIQEAFQYHLRQAGITLRLGEKVVRIEELPPDNGSGALVQATLESGKVLKASTLLYAVGRQGVCGQLGMENVGVYFDDRERLKVNEFYQCLRKIEVEASEFAPLGEPATVSTPGLAAGVAHGAAAAVKQAVIAAIEPNKDRAAALWEPVTHIYAAGDVIGFPALASTSMEQGRRAVGHAFGVGEHQLSNVFPYGIYGIPEISMVGKTEQQLTEEGIPYEAGIASYKELARGQLLGDESGMLKMLIHQDTHHILGVHILGTDATEIIHIGQAVMALGGTAEFFIHNVFNFPTLSEAYKVAAYNGLNKLRHI
jgi:NAD(P) transhydrogenase